MPSLQIRNLPDDIYQTLMYRAKRSHRSLAQQALIELRKATENTGSRRREEILLNIRQSLEEQGPQSRAIRPEDLIREDRER